MMNESSRRYNLRDTRKKPQGELLKRWEVEYSKLISNENRRIPLEIVRAAIRSAFGDGMFEQWRITLKCPLSRQRIKVPARYADCTHIECFDLETFLRMKTQKNIRVCPICQKEIEKPLANLRIDKYMENVLSTLFDAMQVELMPDGSFTEVHEKLVIEPSVIDDEEPYIQDVKQEAVEESDEYITLSDGEEEFMLEISVIDMKPISLMPLNADIKPNIAASSVPEQIHSREDQERQEIESPIPLVPSAVSTTIVKFEQIAVDPIANLLHSATPKAVILPKRELPECVPSVPVGFRIQATLSSIDPTNVDSKPNISASSEQIHSGKAQENRLSREFGYSDEEEEEVDRKGNNEGGPQPKEFILSIARPTLSDGSANHDLQQLTTTSSKQLPSRLLNAPQQIFGAQTFPFPPPNFSVPPPTGMSFFSPINVPPAINPGGNIPRQIPSGILNAPLQTFAAKFYPPYPNNGSDGHNDRFRSDREKSSRKRDKSRTRDCNRDVRGRRDDYRLSKSDQRSDRSDHSPSSSRNDGDRRSNGHRSPPSDRRSTSGPVYSHRNRRHSECEREREHRDKHNRERDKEKSEDTVEDNRCNVIGFMRNVMLEKERRKNGFPTQPKDDHVLIGSRTVWFGRIPANCFENDIRESEKDAGQPEKVIVVAPRGCAYVTMHERRASFKIVDRLGKNLHIAKKPVKISWAIIQGIKDNETLMEYWDSSRGIAQIPFSKLPERLDSLLEGAFLDIHTMPTYLKGLYNARGAIVPGQSFPGMIPGMNASVNVPLPQQIPLTANLFPFQQQLNLPPPIQFGVQANASDQQKQLQNFYPNMSGNLADFGFPPGLFPPGGMDARFRPPFMNPGAFIPNTFSATSAATAPQSVSLIPPPNSIEQSFQQQNLCYELSTRPSQNTLSQCYWPR